MPKKKTQIPIRKLGPYIIKRQQEYISVQFIIYKILKSFAF